MRFPLFAALALLLALAGCDKSKDNPKDEQQPAQTEESTTPPASPKPPQAKLESQPEKLERRPPDCEGKDCPQVSIHREVFPQQSALNQAVRDQLIRQLAGNGEDNGALPSSLEAVAKSFLADATDLPQDAATGWQLTGETKLLDQRGDLATVQIDTYEFTGGAHGMPSTHWLNWDLSADKQLNLADILRPGQEQAFWKVAENAHQRWMKEEADADDDFRQAWPFQKSSDFQITDDGLVLLYAPYAIGPYSMGMPQLTLPWDELKTVVKERFQPGRND